MANTSIVIKRDTRQNEPSSLLGGELAYSFASDKLFIGHPTDGVEYIGGKVIVDKVANLEPLILALDNANEGEFLQIENGEPTFGDIDGGTYDDR